MLRTRAEIHLGHLTQNFKRVQEFVRPAKVIAVVKADAYGHGAVTAARALFAAGAEMFAVAQLPEALELRHSGIRAPILIFGRLFPGELEEAIKADFRITVFCREDLDWIERCRAPRRAKTHLNVDTGMGRIGVRDKEAAPIMNALQNARFCEWEGVYSHFSTSDEKDKSYARRQQRRFERVLSMIEQKRSLPPLVHMANSGGVLNFPECRYTAVRPGLILYGCYPSKESARPVVLRQVMAFRTQVAHLRSLPADCPVSYARKWHTPAETTIAVLPVGYADGVRRDLTNKGHVIINGNKYPMVGTVTMDHIMVHVGADPVKVGDEALIWGGGEESISILEVASSIGTIPYELTCGVSRRVPRITVQ